VYGILVEDAIVVLTNEEKHAIRLQKRMDFKRRQGARVYIERAKCFGPLIKDRFSCPINCAEIGVDSGGYIYHFVDLFKDDISMMYGVDPYAIFGHYSIAGKVRYKRVYHPKWRKEDWDNLYEKVVERFTCHNNVIILRNTSEEAAWIVPDNLHYVFIDAGHDYHNVINDIHLWEEKIVDGGIISGHDYKGKKYHEVTVAVEDYANRFGRKIENPIHGCWYWEVRK